MERKNSQKRTGFSNLNIRITLMLTTLTLAICIILSGIIFFNARKALLNNTNESLVQIAKTAATHAEMAISSNKNDLNFAIKGITYAENGQGYAFIVNKEGYIVAHPDRSLIMSEELYYNRMKDDPEYKTLANLFKKMMNGETGHASYVFRGESKLNGFAPIGDTGYSIAVTAPESEVLLELNNFRASIITIVLAAVAISVVLSILLSSSIAKPIVAITQNAEKIASLDIRDNIKSKYINRKDEIGRIALAFQTILDNLRKFTTDVNSLSKNVASASQELTAISEQTAMASESIAVSSAEVAHNSDKQLKEILDIVSSMEQISASIQEVYGNAEEISQLSDEAFQQTSTGKKDIEKVILQMKNISESTNNVKESLDEVISSSEKMNKIVTLIQNIAEQTNLLALNAAIEAARAGEQGKGFAVVAEEVRKLAEESQNATLEIHKLMNNSNEIIKKANTAMEDSMVDVGKGIETVNAAENSFEHIADLVNRVNKQIEIVTESISQIAKGSEQITFSSTELENMSKVVSEQIQNISASIEENNAAAEEVTTASQSLENLADKLHNSISQIQM